jgi:hypothetical protein
VAVGVGVGRLAPAPPRHVEDQRQLWRECRESAEALTQLRRSLGGVLAEVRYVLSDHDSEGQ